MDERTKEITAEATAIALAIEQGTPVLSRVALRARRLAQLLDDDYAFAWLSLECSGVGPVVKPERPSQSRAELLRAYEKWTALRAAIDLANVNPDLLANAIDAGKLPPRTRILSAGLAALERSLEETHVEVLRWADHAPNTAGNLRLFEIEIRGVLERVASAIHEWATGVYTAHRFRQLAGGIFDRLKTSSDSALGALCPEAINKLNHAIERAGTDNPEAWSAAAMSCRRALRDFADVAYPPRAELVDTRKVGPEEYKNRLWAYAKSRGTTAIEREALSLEEIEGLCKSLDRVYDLDSKGVHDKVSKHEADMLVVRTYILLAQMAALHSNAAA